MYLAGVLGITGGMSNMQLEASVQPGSTRMEGEVARILDETFV